MNERLESQIVIDDAEFLSAKRDTVKRGRKERLSVDRFLDVVKRKKSLEDSVIADSVGMNRNSVWYWKKRHPLAVENAERILNEIENIRFDNSLSIEIFKNIPTIKDWIEDMNSKKLSKTTILYLIRVMYNVCTHLNIHIDNLNVDQVAELVKEVKLKHIRNESVKKGLTYYYIRKPIRAFFMQTRGISGDLLSRKGISAEKCAGWGSYAKERVTPEQRRILPEKLEEVIKECFEPNDILHKGKILNIGNENLDDVVLEFQNIDYFMYYTATRIKATLNIRLNDRENVLTDNIYKIKVVDKGEKGGKEWNKILIDDSLDRMKNYLAQRFSIDEYGLENKIPQIDDYLFPFWRSKYRYECVIQKEALKRCGKITDIPNHIFRHTFAQDFLHASDWNYELCASLGGWSSTNTLKEHYGKMSEDAKIRGLKKSMDEKVEDVTYELRW